MTKTIETLHFSYESLLEAYVPTDATEEAHKLGYVKKRNYLTTPNLEYYALPDGNYIAIDKQYDYDGTEIRGLYLVTSESEEDKTIRLEREAAEVEAESLKKAQDRAAKKLAKSQELDKAKKALEKAGFTVTK